MLVIQISTSLNYVSQEREQFAALIFHHAAPQQLFVR